MVSPIKEKHNVNFLYCRKVKAGDNTNNKIPRTDEIFNKENFISLSKIFFQE